jgi:hypothetical protein
MTNTHGIAHCPRGPAVAAPPPPVPPPVLDLFKASAALLESDPSDAELKAVAALLLRGVMAALRRNHSAPTPTSHTSATLPPDHPQPAAVAAPPPPPAPPPTPLDLFKASAALLESDPSDAESKAVAALLLRGLMAALRRTRAPGTTTAEALAAPPTASTPAPTAETLTAPTPAPSSSTAEAISTPAPSSSTRTTTPAPAAAATPATPSPPQARTAAQPSRRPPPSMFPTKGKHPSRGDAMAPAPCTRTKADVYVYTFGGEPH